jgi:hypothetical protein
MPTERHHHQQQARIIRFTGDQRCPICGGADADPRGSGVRCHGFRTADGWAHCAREEHAHGLPREDGGTYAHKLGGRCNCGQVHDQVSIAAAKVRAGAAPRPTIVRQSAAYDYRDEAGELLFQVVRYEPKAFRQAT